MLLYLPHLEIKLAKGRLKLALWWGFGNAHTHRDFLKEISFILVYLSHGQVLDLNLF